MNTIIAIDPGTMESGVIIWDGSKQIEMARKIENNELLRMMRLRDERSPLGFTQLYIEMMACYGMPVGAEVLETCVWIGRFQEAFKGRAYRIVRKEVKMHHCGNNTAKDSNIIQALKDKYGDKGTKKAPGFFYGFSADVWQAFALAACVHEKQGGGNLKRYPDYPT